MKKLRTFFSKNLCSNLVPVFFAIALIAIAERRMNSSDTNSMTLTEKTGDPARQVAREIAGNQIGKESTESYVEAQPVATTSLEETATGKIEIPASKLAVVLVYATHLFNIAR